MKGRDYKVYTLSLLTFALLVLSPLIIDAVFAPGMPVTEILGAWLAHGERFVNSMVYAAGYPL